MAASSPGHIELERSLASIRVGTRHRVDLGDIDALAASIRTEGLLQPITVTPDGLLVCGRRRLEALRRLGHRTANVWVRSGVSDRLGQLLAEQNDNMLHKPLNLLEAESLYRELKAVMAEDAARRQAATRFGTAPETAADGGEDGAANLAAPSHHATGDARAQAARLVTGRAAYTTLERLGRLRDLAADPAQPEHIRAQAAEEVARIEAGGKVHGAHLRMNTALSLAELDRIAADAGQQELVREQAASSAAEVRANASARTADLEQLATEAVARVKGHGSIKAPAVTEHPRAHLSPMLPARALVGLWDDLSGWTEKYDPAQVAADLTPAEWERVEAVVAETTTFFTRVRYARSTTSLRSLGALAG
ncbi:MAG: ParB N-terminal domain-containing protein [Actinobacteria bacterium]|nr:ParB N-terminal domain-containing protein [Actinomycetota bacterium]